MNTTTSKLVYAIALGQILFGIVALVTGWTSSAEALGVIMLGLSTFGIHHSNVATAAAARGI